MLRLPMVGCCSGRRRVSSHEQFAGNVDDAEEAGHSIHSVAHRGEQPDNGVIQNPGDAPSRQTRACASLCKAECRDDRVTPRFRRQIDWYFSRLQDSFQTAFCLPPSQNLQQSRFAVIADRIRGTRKSLSGPWHEAGRGQDRIDSGRRLRHNFLREFPYALALLWVGSDRRWRQSGYTTKPQSRWRAPSKVWSSSR